MSTSFLFSKPPLQTVYNTKWRLHGSALPGTIYLLTSSKVSPQDVGDYQWLRDQETLKILICGFLFFFLLVFIEMIFFIFFVFSGVQNVPDIIHNLMFFTSGLHQTFSHILVSLETNKSTIFFFHGNPHYLAILSVKQLGKTKTNLSIHKYVVLANFLRFMQCCSISPQDLKYASVSCLWTLECLDVNYGASCQACHCLKPTQRKMTESMSLEFFKRKYV